MKSGPEELTFFFKIHNDKKKKKKEFLLLFFFFFFSNPGPITLFSTSGMHTNQ